MVVEIGRVRCWLVCLLFFFGCVGVVLGVFVSGNKCLV